MISPMEEARLTWAGCVFELDLPDEGFAVVDLGGGSTEIVMACTQVDSTVQHSLPLGTVRLTEAFFDPQPGPYKQDQFDALKAHIETALCSLDWHRAPSALIAVAGTATTLATMDLGLTSWDRSAVHGACLSLSALERWMDRLLHSHPDTRREWCCCSPLRADGLLAGAAVLHAVCSATGQTELIISDGGIRHGILVS